ncbi:hypothetical protein KR026_006176 [Drosophila bipectinata]|nr:hypothetical protein KR026_006176 [Drosophila bipectinata]
MWQLALALGLLQHLSILAIVVERNMFAYYKVPADQLLLAQNTDYEYESQELAHPFDGKEVFYVLQCPPKLEEGIPKPQDMQTCNVVDQYKDIWKKKQKSRSKKRLHMVPFRIVLRPLRPPAMRRSHKRSKRQHKRDKEFNPGKDRNPENLSSPLEHLGRPHRKQKLLKLSADHRRFKRGNSSKGFQHMYHRDESYNDHIFYDELHADGKFRNSGKEKYN